MISKFYSLLLILKREFELYTAKKISVHELKLNDIKFKFTFPQKKITSYSHFLRSKSNWEPHCTTVIKSLLNENDSVLQLGTALGYFSCLMKKMQNNESFFWGVEKSIEGSECTKKNFLINEFKNYQLINKTISNKNLGEEITFKNLLENIDKKINILFTDIEGAEQLIFEDIINHNISIDKMVIGFHLIDEIPTQERKQTRYKYFYTKKKFNEFLLELSKNYHLKIDIDNLILIKK